MVRFDYGEKPGARRGCCCLPPEAKFCFFNKTHTRFFVFFFFQRKMDRSERYDVLAQPIQRWISIT